MRFGELRRSRGDLILTCHHRDEGINRILSTVAERGATKGDTRSPPVYRPARDVVCGLARDRPIVWSEARIDMRNDLFASGEARRGRLAAERPGSVACVALVDADRPASLGPPHQLSGLLGHPSRWRDMPPAHRTTRVGPAVSRIDDIGVCIPVVAACKSGWMRVDAPYPLTRKSNCTRQQHIDLKTSQMRVRRCEDRRSGG
ncbi:hypothetical protein FIU91_03400 [Roseivivax sp. THAF30]|nr:hypothetical protein FIU91_03400 [Roseivivax sp. THAF30]